MRAALLVIIVPSVMLAFSSHAADRSKSVRAEFQRGHPCTATGQPRGACPGYVVDHIKPLCAGGADAPSNMQWQTVEAGKVKDRAERAQCSRR